MATTATCIAWRTKANDKRDRVKIADVGVAKLLGLVAPPSQEVEVSFMVPWGTPPIFVSQFYPVSGKKLGRFTPRNGCMTPRIWQKCISQLRPPQS